MKNFQRLTLTAVLTGSALLATGCSGSAPQAPTASPDVASPVASVVASPVATVPPKLGAGIIAKGVANDSKGDYLQTSIADTDPAMQYNPVIADAAAKAHYSAAELSEAQKVVVKFIAEEVIDSTLNGGTDVDGWWAAHKDQIHPGNLAPMLADLKKTDTDILVRESWIARYPGYSYVHGVETPRVSVRTISPYKIGYVESSTLQGATVSTDASWSMNVINEEGHNGVQKSTAKLTFSVVKDPADGKWKIAGYNTDYHTDKG